MSWTANDMPDLGGKTIVVTGANSGLGLEASRAFARGRARVVLACRNVEKAGVARSAILASVPEADVEVRALDLASLASVRTFADSFVSSHGRLDVLCNNAGVMALPRRETAEGFEMQLGTNHLGHFALTGLLLPLLERTPKARVVTQSSSAHRMGRIDFDDLHGRRRYGRWRAYAQSKLANLLLAYELQRRLEKKEVGVISVACYPGYAATELQFAAARMEGLRWMEHLFALGNRLFAQDAVTGSLPMLYAATAPDVHGGDYIGPDGLGEFWGYPVEVDSSAASHDVLSAAHLWEVSQDLTGVRY